MESATPTVSEKVDDEETDLNKISEEAEESPLLEPEPPAKKLIVQHMPQISIRPPLTLHKIFDIEIRPTGSFSYRSPDFRNIHYEEIYSPLTKSTGQQTSSTLLKKAEKADRICSCGPQDIKADLVQIPIQSIPDSESAKLSSEELTKAKSAELTKSDTDTVKSVSELSGRTSSIDTDSETRGSSVTEKTKRASSSPTPDSVLQKTVKPPSRPESLEKPLRLDSKTEKRRVSKTIPPESDSKQLLKTKLDSKKELVEKLAAEKPTEPVEQEFVSRSASLPPVDIVAAKMFTSSAKSSFLNEAGIIKITPEKVDIFEISSMKTFQKAAEIGPKSIGAKKLSAIEETKEPEIGTCASIVQDCTCSSPDLQCNVKKLGATEETKMGTCATLVQDCKCSSDDVQCNGKETSAERYEAIDIHKDKFPVHFTQDNQLASIDSSVQNGKDAKVNQLTGLLDTSRAILSESEPNIKYMNEAYREQTVSEKQFGPHPESSASAYSVPEKETEPPSASKTKIHFNKDDELKCQCNLVSDASVSEENPVTSSNPDIPLQKSSESVYVLTHDISIQSSPTHIPVATKSVPVKRKSLGEKRNSSGRGAKMRQPRKRSTFKSPVSSKISYLTKSNEKSLTLVQGTALKGSATQRQGNSKKTNNLSKPRSQEATEVERPNSRSRVSTPEASKRHDVIPEETIPEQDYHSPTVMSVAVQYQMQKSLVDVLYPRLHKSRNCNDLDTSSSEFDGYRKLGKNKLSDDTEDSNINPYKMYCGDSLDYMRRYQKNEGGDVNNGKIKKVIRRPAQTISFSSASNSASHRLEESLSEGEIRCKCSISIGELHICRYVQQIKERAKVSRRKQDDSSSCRKWVNSKSDSSTKIDASTTEPSSDT